MHSSIRGNGYESRTVIALSFLWSTQNRVDPSGLATKTIGLAHSELAGSVTSAFSIRCISADYTARARGPALYG
jgi:hypothetical protein